MVSIYIKGKQECFKDMEDMIYNLKVFHDIDLRSLNIITTQDIEEGIGESLNNLDCIDTDEIEESLKGLKSYLNSLRIGKDKKDHIEKLIENIECQLDDNINQYLGITFNELDIIHNKIKSL